MSVEVNGKQVDLTKALPLTLGDLKALKKIGVTMTKVNFVEDPDIGANFVHYVLHKANTEVAMEDVDALSIGRLFQIARSIDQATGDLDLPFSTPSTPSPEPTAGISET